MLQINLKRHLKLLIAVSTLLLTGCITTKTRNSAEQFMARPDFEAAVMAAPEWCRDVLKKLSEYEYELSRK